MLIHPLFTRDDPAFIENALLTFEKCRRTRRPRYLYYSPTHGYCSIAFGKVTTLPVGTLVKLFYPNRCDMGLYGIRKDGVSKSPYVRFHNPS